MHEKETSKITIPKEGEGALSIHGYYTAPESIRESFWTVIGSHLTILKKFLIRNIRFPIQSKVSNFRQFP